MRVRFGGHLAQQAALDDAKHFVAFDRLAPLVFARGQMVKRLEQIDVVERFAFARLQARKPARCWGALPTATVRRLMKFSVSSRKRRVEDFDAAGADEVFEHFIQQDQIGRVAKQFQDVVAAGRNAGLVVLAEDFVAGGAAKRPGDPAPERVRLAFAAGEVLPVGRAEKLSVENGGIHLAGFGQGFAFGNDVERVAVAGGVVKRSERVRFAAAKGRDELQNPVARAAGQARQARPASSDFKPFVR